jgi:hypothetical protein
MASDPNLSNDLPENFGEWPDFSELEGKLRDSPLGNLLATIADAKPTDCLPEDIDEVLKRYTEESDGK